MPTTPVLCRYQYDPLDRLTACAQPDALQAQRFYLKNRQTTEIEGLVRRSIFQHADVLLAEQRHTGQGADTSLLATDQQRSVLQVASPQGAAPLVHTPYGHRTGESGLLSLLGFNGERPDPLTGHYLLGNGYRAFNPVLMRFHSPDSLSPFGRGGLNTYAYCVGDPVNRADPTGHMPLNILAKVAGKTAPRVSAPTATAQTVVESASTSQAARVSNQASSISPAVVGDGIPGYNTAVGGQGKLPGYGTAVTGVPSVARMPMVLEPTHGDILSAVGQLEGARMRFAKADKYVLRGVSQNARPEYVAAHREGGCRS